jgi:hypothetical protein
MSALDFNTAEAELREVERDYAEGRLSAFGAGGTQEEVLREMKKLSELEVQVFIRTCAQVRALADEESLVQRTLRDQHGHSKSLLLATGAAQAGGSEAAGHDPSADHNALETVPRSPPSAGQQVHDSSFPAQPGSSGGPSPAAHRGATRDTGANAGAASTETGATSGVPNASFDPAATADLWSLHGSTDKAFEDMAKLFKAKETALKASADNLRQMAKHIASAHEILQKAHGPA